MAFPLDVEPGDLEDADDRFGHFGADAVAGDQRDDMFHKRCENGVRSGAGGGHRRRQQRGDLLQQRTIVVAEGGRAVAVDVEFAEHLDCIPNWYTPLIVTNEAMLRHDPDTVRAFLDVTASRALFGDGETIEVEPLLAPDLYHIVHLSKRIREENGLRSGVVSGGGSLPTPFEISDRLTESYADLSPSLATTYGVPGRDHLWDDFTPGKPFASGSLVQVRSLRESDHVQAGDRSIAASISGRTGSCSGCAS
mgnify:CR=1 FL=1